MVVVDTKFIYIKIQTFCQRPMSQINLHLCSLDYVHVCIFSSITVLKKNPFCHKSILSSAIYLLFYGRGFLHCWDIYWFGSLHSFSSFKLCSSNFFPLSNFPLLPINPHNLQSLSIFLLNLSGFSEVFSDIIFVSKVSWINCN